MFALLTIIAMIVNLIIFVLIVQAVLSWLMMFGILNMNNQFIATVYSTLQALTEPMLRPIRRFIPPVGGLDLSFLVLIFALYFVEAFVTVDLPRMIGL